MPSSDEQRVYTTLLLLSLALRPVADGTDPDLIRLDRTALWRLADASGARAHVGRSTFYALAAELSDDVPDAVEVLPRGGNRTTVQLFRVEADPDTWTDEVLAPLGFENLAAAATAAAALGIDTQSPLPTDALLPAGDDDSEEEDLTEKSCTRCRVTQPVEEFPERNSGRLQSWCRACSTQATREYRSRMRPTGAPTLPAPAARKTTASTVRDGDKVCPGCHTRKPLTHFHRDSSRGDDHAVRCKVCRADSDYNAALRRYTDI